MEQNENTGDILIYQSENGLTRIDVRLEQETVWLTMDQMCMLFGKANPPSVSIYRTYMPKENWLRARQ